MSRRNRKCGGRRSRKQSGLKKITAIVPKTFKATKAVGSRVVKDINYFLSKTVKTIRGLSKGVDKKTAKAIRSFTRRRGRK